MTSKNSGCDNTMDPSTGSGQTLRSWAEEKARSDEAESLESLSPEESRQVLHELRVHQIELETQNEELRRTQAELEASRARYFDLYDLAPVGYFTIGENGLILEANLTAAKLLGMDRRQWVRRPFAHLVAHEDRETYSRHCKRLFETGEPQAWEIRMLGAHAAPFWVRLQATVAQDAGGAPVCRVAMSDISERKRAEDDLRHAKDAIETANREIKQSLAREQVLARFDGLTGLCNRRHFFDLAARELSAALRFKRPLTIVMFDVDGFKQVNDTLGHSVGDTVLTRVAQTAAAEIRDIDVLARYGGDEFVILLSHTTAQQALPFAERVSEKCAATRVETAKGPLSVTLSIGIAEMRREPLDQSIESVVQRADKALYAAKTEGRNRIVTYSAEMQGRKQ